MNNTMTISDGIKKSIVKDYENKLFKMYERILIKLNLMMDINVLLLLLYIKMDKII